ncbi:hypothetical protein [Halocatena salina]|uniref:Uncharacterized protein n=1 Tax=Halocatena salina TaxID=2934340 RepID=A0A8U0A789_9EURY|nr:hypothetical protein [Halocatena salina]UPM44706.1 hypothetical protein MW046_16880 [Halocatena salina]
MVERLRGDLERFAEEHGDSGRSEITIFAYDALEIELAGNTNCVETFAIEAEYADVSRFIATVRGTDASVSAEYTAILIDVVSTEIVEHVTE